jgi:hypothetical protein
MNFPECSSATNAPPIFQNAIFTQLLEVERRRCFTPQRRDFSRIGYRTLLSRTPQAAAMIGSSSKQPEPTTVRLDPQKAIQMLDLMEEFFDGGLRWIRGFYEDDHGNRCLMGALTYLSKNREAAADYASIYLHIALPKRYMLAHRFNDDCWSYSQIRALIHRARELARHDLNAMQTPRTKIAA